MLGLAQHKRPLPLYRASQISVELWQTPTHTHSHTHTTTMCVCILFESIVKFTFSAIFSLQYRSVGVERPRPAANLAEPHQFQPIPRGLTHTHTHTRTRTHTHISWLAITGVPTQEM